MKPAPALDPRNAPAPTAASGEAAPARTPSLTAVPAAASAPRSLLDTYLDRQSDAARASTRSALKRAARALDSVPEEVRWELIRHHQLKEISARLYRREGYEPATVNASLSAVKGLAQLAWECDLMKEQDFTLIKKVRGIRKRRLSRGRVLQPEELSALKASCDEDENEARGARDWAAIAGLLLGAGLRRAEAASLQLKHFDPDTFTLRVRGKGDCERLAFVSDSGAREALAEWLELRGAATGPLLCRVHRSGTITHRALTPQSVYDLTTRRAKAAGITAFSPHDLRKTFATLVIKNTGDLRAAQLLLGHADINTTTIYDLRDEETLREAARIDYVPSGYPGRRRKPRYGKRRRRPPTPGIKTTRKLRRLAAIAWAMQDAGNPKDLS